MSLAIAFARAQLGRTAPNPAVGCVLVRDGKLLAAAATDDGGRPHAERRALDHAGHEAEDATAYVTLEPCAHYGQTPPCADALVEARVSRVVIACMDEDKRVAGKGVDTLRRAGIIVQTGLGEDLATPLYSGFFHRLRHGRPALFADPFDQGFDGTLDRVDAAQLDRTLLDLGRAGASRIRVSPDHPLLAEGQLTLD
jgi:diaminohydroxyphosphoribosylaminopyrimidine deaminase/5-amino-6-(5-phosphoribosylamino)uracil reductase